ncbi:MAG TPA: RidA family protein [Blastocatellia bacterium]|nr:RidA family protein [Blastocatellia bacterium]
MLKTTSRLLLLLLLFPLLVCAQERKVIVPANAAKPVGPYSPGILVKDYLYVSGQGVRDAKNDMPDGIAAQARQCLENVKAIIEAANLTMEHVVHMQLYLERMSDLAEVEKVYAGYFPHNPPARIVIGVARMPTDTTIEMTAVVVRSLQQKKVLALKSLPPLGHASPAIQVGNRVYFSGVYGKSANEAEANMKKVLAEAKLKSSNVVLSNFYGVTPSAIIPMRELPNQMQAAYSVIAAKKVKRVPRSATYCAADGDTVFCSVQLGNEAANKTVPDQVKAAMQKLYAGLESHDAKLSMVTASNVYLDDIKDFALMNQTYATFFRNAPPTRTTVQPFPVANRTQGNPPLVRISVVAVKE